MFIMANKFSSSSSIYCISDLQLPWRFALTYECSCTCIYYIYESMKNIHMRTRVSLRDWRLLITLQSS